MSLNGTLEEKRDLCLPEPRICHVKSCHVIHHVRVSRPETTSPNEFFSYSANRSFGFRDGGGGGGTGAKKKKEGKGKGKGGE